MAPKAGSGRGRSILAWTLLVLACVLAPLALVASWGRDQVLDTDRYVATVKPLAGDPAIQEAVGNRITTTLFTQVDVEALAQEALPARADRFAAPLAAALERFVREQVDRVVTSPEFVTFWEEASRRVHTQLVRVLTGREDGRVVTVENEDVVIDLSALATRVRARLSERGIDLPQPTGRALVGPARFVVADASGLQSARRGARLLDRLSWLLAVLAFLALVGAIVAFRDRRKGVFRAGVGIAIAMLLTGVGLAVGRSVYLDALPEGVNSDAAAVFFDTLVRYLRYALRVLLAVALLAALVAWIAGPATSAVRLREWFSGRRGERGAGVAAWVARNRNVLRGAVGVLVALFLVAMDRPRLPVLVVVAVIAVGLLLLIEAAARLERSEGQPQPRA